MDSISQPPGLTSFNVPGKRFSFQNKTEGAELLDEQRTAGLGGRDDVSTLSASWQELPPIRHWVVLKIAGKLLKFMFHVWTDLLSLMFNGASE